MGASPRIDQLLDTLYTYNEAFQIPFKILDMIRGDCGSVLIIELTQEQANRIIAATIPASGVPWSFVILELTSRRALERCTNICFVL